MPHRDTDLFQYTSGRWLWDEEQQLRERFSPFNVPELQRIAAQSVGADTCTAITKLAEGSFNKTFRLQMDNGSSVIARIPHPIAGPRHYTTASEVATMEFARTILGVPTPRVYAWNADVNNAVGSEYIIMEEAAGTKLDDIWDVISLEEKIEIMKDLVQLEKKMLQVPLNNYGSLYFANTNIRGATPVDICADVSPELKDKINRRFVIGPVAERHYWLKERAEMALDRGPWKQPQDYVLSLAHREEAWIQKYATPRPKDDPLVTSASQNSPNSHIDLLHKYLKVAPYLLPNAPAVVAPYIWHTDLHAGNIFVQKGKISSVIDWQGLWAAPLILQARHARLVDYNGEVILKAPANFKDLEPAEKTRIRGLMSSSILLYLYEKQIAQDIPLLDRVLRFDHGRIRCEPILFVGDTWDDEIIPLRESLIRVERSWNELGFDFPCPINFTEDDLRIHAEESDGWNDVQEFWDSVAHIVSRDGWTPHHLYDDAISLFTELRDIGLKAMVGKERDAFEKQTQWVKKH
ncbi:phosphotransferase enzyme [Aspergillus luchuensis]|uniref:Phosphotransferase enzyme n=2 Tax=Aspergillus subgen. Circumdati TaxID=2720871 RepID=A0A7R7W666_ASPKA|nr:phosphotransferase enzyme [Aspergillus luchuensis]BCR96713.1 phosphotransferase enzyme [Aspergillus luchuensis]GAA93052.1 phosphotransferase family protein [Aspergillus luchuensis IFO 4308]GJP97037.1 phosphotransferase family protein [Aspergillus niger]